jgi:membrane fusion protein, multidrug efflux system
MDGSTLAARIDLGAGVSIARPRRSWRPRRLLVPLAVLIVLCGAGLYGRYYWTTGRFLVSTDDATVQADSVIISPKVSGYLAQVQVQDNEPVHPGQVLAVIDDRDYRTALAASRAMVDAAQASVDVLRQQIAEQQLAVSQTRAVVDADQADLTFSQQEYGRVAGLERTGATPVRESQQWQAAVREKAAALARDTLAVSVAQKQIDVMDAQLANANAALAEQQAVLHQAELNLGYTTITAPVDGTVGDRTLRVGQYVQAGTQLMAVVPLSAVYLTANYKETQLTDVRPGQNVTIAIDTFPSATVHGVVNSIAPASGEEFALLPPDNATGNFTKIVQRIPVKIAIDPKDPLLGELRPGMSVEPTIDTRIRPGA